MSQDKIILELTADGYNVPVDISTDGTDRLYIVEKRGTVLIYDFENGKLASPFLDIRSKVNATSGERGLLGLTFHPAYMDNGFFYVNYTRSDGATVIARYSVDPENPDEAMADSEKVLLTVPQPFQNHNAGDLSFGPDGYLYIGLGDGGSADDPDNRSQNPQELLGKMLRIDVDNGDPYSIPEDNPYADDDFAKDEIWAMGLRNPWRFSFDRMTGDLWIADVGQGDWEEVNLQPASSVGGENYGWRCYEGNDIHISGGCADRDQYTFPLYAYAHEGFNCSGSITGGFRYYGSSGSLYGLYICVDYCTGKFYGVNPIDSTAEVLLEGNGGVFTTFGESSDGELYVAAGSGEIFRIKGPGTARAKVPVIQPLSIAPVPATNVVQISGNGIDQAGEVSVYNILGNKVLYYKYVDLYSVDVSPLRPGTYLVHVTSGGRGYTGKLLVID